MKDDIQKKIDELSGEKITKEFIDTHIKLVEYHQLPKSTVTICNITLTNGFSVRGESACVDPKNFDEEIGRSIAYDNAYSKLWSLFGFLLAEKLYGNTFGSSPFTPNEIAQICHEVNRAYCQALGDESQPPWSEAPEWQRKSARTGVMLHINNPDAGPEASHNSWMAEKGADGWTYGEKKDPDAKEHPCMVPFSALETDQQAKDFIFRAVVHAITNIR